MHNGIYLAKWSMWTWNGYLFCCRCMEHSINVTYTQMNDAVLLGTCIWTYFFLTVSVIKRDVGVWPVRGGGAFFFKCYEHETCILKEYCQEQPHKDSLGKLTLYSYEWQFDFYYSFVRKCTLSKTNMDTSFLSLEWTHCITFPSFNFNLCKLFYLKWTTCNWYMLENLWLIIQAVATICLYILASRWKRLRIWLD